MCNENTIRNHLSKSDSSSESSSGSSSVEHSLLSDIKEDGRGGARFAANFNKGPPQTITKMDNAQKAEFAEAAAEFLEEMGLETESEDES